MTKRNYWQLNVRRRRFDVSGLNRIACQALETGVRSSFEKIGEGNFNKACSEVIAQAPHPNAGPRLLTTASEVATMEFARAQMIAWSATDQNSAGIEYIILEEAKGASLHEVWDQLTPRAKLDIIQGIVDLEKKMLSVSFTKADSLYFSDEKVAGREPAEGICDSPKLVDRVRARFCIVPITRRDHWMKERESMGQFQVSWTFVGWRKIEWIQKYAIPGNSKENSWQYKSAEQDVPEGREAAPRKYLLAILCMMPIDPDLTSPRIWHPDSHAGNIFIDEQNRISSIIDWQGAVDVLTKLPDTFKSLEDSTKESLRYQVAQSVLIHTYETKTADKNRLMLKMILLQHGQTIKQLEAFAGCTWENYLFPFQECLIRAEKEWEYFDTNEPCPYHHHTKELQNHYDEFENFNAYEDF
ncbi:hypothetical protein K431DRAFT_322140 [Polychaeton citri CBS 116435]|uniref:Altered inheritance of mitochondria protein 9, mitochondrial n=1 Tax=Polychaeton citri CBS 116435 TaxID=1314669 RepID=A0A9P4ULR9_9PEZI|nr:hypothetical protein K431DRAFT_322140 [Polychaeton citri CBS 116435]